MEDNTNKQNKTRLSQKNSRMRWVAGGNLAGLGMQFSAPLQCKKPATCSSSCWFYWKVASSCCSLVEILSSCRRSIFECVLFGGRLEACHRSLDSHHQPSVLTPMCSFTPSGATTMEPQGRWGGVWGWSGPPSLLCGPLASCSRPWNRRASRGSTTQSPTSQNWSRCMMSRAAVG